MKGQKGIAVFCIGLFTALSLSVPRPVKAEPFTLWGVIKVLSILAGIASLWVAIEQATLAEHNAALASTLNHLDANPEFPMDGACVSPDIRDGNVSRGWLVSIDNESYLHHVVKGEFCSEGGISNGNRYVIGIFTSEFHALNFAKIVSYRTNNDIDVYITKEAVDLAS